MYLKDLRKMNNEKIVESLNSAQRSYNNRFKIWEYTRNATDCYFMDVYLRTINNCKKVLAERNLKVEFTYKGWEVVE